MTARAIGRETGWETGRPRPRPVLRPRPPRAILPAMTRETVNRLCAALPGAECSDPWGGGHDAWKVGGKMFACIGAMDRGVAVKCDDVETAEMLIETGRAERAPYFHRSWVLVPWAQAADEAELSHRIRHSYVLIRGKLTKKAQAALGRFDEAADADA